jgi:tetratricopeptide (TPR) repeat protein
MSTPPPLRHDLQARLWTEVANARRVASEWSKASAALIQAGKHLKEGSGDPLLWARAHSVSASLLADQGRSDDAVAALEKCVALYEEQHAWPEVGRVLVQMAHALVDTAPTRALDLIGRAAPFISAADLSLRCLAENIRSDALITLGEVELALRVFDLAERLRKSGAPDVARRRSDFIAARLLEQLGHDKEAIQLFEAVVADAFDHEAYREAFLDLLYLFSVHLRQGAPDRAVAVCRLAIERLDFFGLGHEQLRAVWAKLGEAAVGRSIAVEGLAEVRQFLKAHWKIPAAKAPRFTFE